MLRTSKNPSRAALAQPGDYCLLNYAYCVHPFTMLCVRNNDEDAENTTGTWAAYVAALIDTTGGRASDLARRAGINSSIISRWLTTTAQPDLPTLRKISEALHIPLLELLVRSGHLTEQEAGMKLPATPPRPSTPEEAIRADDRIPDHHREVLDAILRVIREQTGDDPWKRGRGRLSNAVG